MITGAMRYLIVIKSLWLISLVLVPFSVISKTQETYDNVQEAKGCQRLDTQAKGATFVLYLPAQEKSLVCNLTAAKRRVSPASTFKIAHALIALETAVITDPFKVEETDGKQRVVPSWNQPTSLYSGLKNSTVWFYQRLAQQIGLKREREWLQRLKYGNAEVASTTELTTFWLTGSLRISALEQVSFLNRLKRGQLDASSLNQKQVASMMWVKNDDVGQTNGKLFAKSGAVFAIGKDGNIKAGEAAKQMLEGIEQVGWYVGWLERSKDSGGDAVFALHLPMRTQNALAKRKKLTLELLGVNGVR